MPTQIISLAASAGVTLRISTKSVVAHIKRPIPLVWLRLVKVETIMLRGYLKISIQGVCATSSTVVGSATSLGSIINAQATDWRASATRPLRISQRGDSGTQARI